MKVIIIGAGKVGYTLAENLVGEGFSVTIIDKDPDALEKLENSLDVMCLKGSGVSTSVLLEAGVDTANLLIAVTESDEVNMVCCLTAKKLGAANTIARIRDPEYAKELSMLREQLGLNLVINPERAAADEIAGSLSFSTAINVENFARGLIKLVDIKATHDMNMIGKTIKKIDKETSSSVLIGAIVREGKVILPTGDSVIEENDDIYIIGKHSSVYKFCKLYNRQPQKIKKVMIIGGGRIGYYLSELLSEMGIKVVIVEKDRHRCEKLTEDLPTALIINDDGTDEAVLKSENVGSMDAFVAVTGMDEENLMSSLIAKREGAKKIITKISRANYVNIVKEIGLDTIISPKQIVSNQILKYVNGKRLESFMRIIDGQAEIMEFIIGSDSKVVNKAIKDISMPGNMIIAIIARKNEIVVPHGSDVIREGDRILVLSMEHDISLAEGIFLNGSGGVQNELLNGIKKFGNIINM